MDSHPKKQMAIRYTDEKKKEVLAWIQDYDKEKGRGGQTEASKKFGISSLTISQWRKKAAASPKDTKRGRKVKVARGRRKVGSASSGLSVMLSRMAAIRGEIEDLEAEYQSLKARL